MDGQRLMTPEERREKFLEQISTLRYFDDVFMTSALSDPATVQVVLEAILEETIVIQRVETQYTEENLFGRGVRMDCW